MGSLSFGNHLNTFEQRLVWSFSWWGQDIEEPKDNLMCIYVDVRTGKQEVDFSYLKSEEDQMPDPFAGPMNLLVSDEFVHAANCQPLAV